MLWPASPLYRYGILTATFLCVFIWSIWSPSTPEVVRSSLSNLKSHLHYDDSEQPHITQLPTTTKLPTHHVPSNHPTLINSAPVATATAEQKFPGEGLDKFEKPKDFKIIALVFFGRREYVQILDCYLQRNLVRNGGLVDQVIFIVRTNDQADLDWLEELLPTVPEYSRHNAQGRGGKFAEAWDVVKRGAMYIKIDDDVVFIEDTTFAAVVKRKMEHPEYVLVSANVVNQPALAFVHYHLGTAHPYLPEVKKPADFIANPLLRPSTWRASELPLWAPPHENFTFDHRYTRNGTNIVNESYPAPFKGHRWLPVGSDADIMDTPITAASYNKGGPGFYSWVVAAQTHYSFLQNLENHDLWKYKFDIWDYDYERLSINFICVWGDDIVDNRPFGVNDDERFLTMILPPRLKRHAVLDGTALAVHFGFSKQVQGHGRIPGTAKTWNLGYGLRDTDVLDRYRAYAEENICKTEHPYDYRKRPDYKSAADRYDKENQKAGS